MLPRGLAAVNVICIGALPTVAEPVVGVAPIDVLCVVADPPGGGGVVLSPPPQPAITAAASNDRHTLRATCAVNLEVMSIVLAPSSPSGPSGSELCLRPNKKKLGKTDEVH